MHFANPTGLDTSSTTAGAYGSARDMALLVSDFLRQYPVLFSATVNETTPMKATAEPILDIPGLIGAKTGYTDLAGGNLVAAFDIEVGHPIVVVVLGSSREGRFTDVRNLIDAARAVLAKN
jgi:D-alanyl-D-alanine carboxypeptidase